MSIFYNEQKANKLLNSVLIIVATSPANPNSPIASAFDDAQNERCVWMLAVLGTCAMMVATMFFGAHDALWLAPLGVALTLVAWLGYRWLPVWALCHFIILCLFVDSQNGWLQHFIAACLLAGQVALSWYAFNRLNCQRRKFGDPQSATLFLLLVPGICAAAFAFVAAVMRHGWLLTDNDFWEAVGNLWLSRILGVMVLSAPLLIVATPWLMQWRMIPPTTDETETQWTTVPRWTTGEILETAGLSLCALILALLMTMDRHQGVPNWRWWVVMLLVIVWAGLRLPMRGGMLVACFSSMCALIVAAVLGRQSYPAVFQGYLLTQCSTAWLVGASVNWIRASEERYRQVVGDLPVVLYSIRLGQSPPKDNGNGRQPKEHEKLWQSILRQAKVILVSPAAQQLLGCSPKELLGEFQMWKQRIEPDDLEVVDAAIRQMAREEAPVTYEYRIAKVDGCVVRDTPLPAALGGENHLEQALSLPIWVRDTLVPHYHDGQLDGWDGILENITERRRLAQQLRRTTSMLQSLVAHLPTGVYFVQGPGGQPILVNARARQLLGQREDLAAGYQHLPAVFRLHRPDGTAYPVDELPVTKALKHRITTMADDVVVHRADGRKVPLITWAAPVDLTGLGEPDGAVWVLEDLTEMQQSELGRRETEARLRAVIKTMAEGVIVLDRERNVIELNPAACDILGVDMDRVLGESLDSVLSKFCDQDGRILSTDRSPFAAVFERRQPVRNVVLGMRPTETDALRNGSRDRWILLNAMPLPALHSLPITHKEGRVVVTFANITDHRRAMDQLREVKERFQNLIESLPLSVLQFEKEHRLTYANPAAIHLLGYDSAQLFELDFVAGVVHPDDRPSFQNILASDSTQECAPTEIRFWAKDHSLTTGLVFVQAATSENSSSSAHCLILDLTAQRRLEQKVQHAQRLEIMGKLASGTIHDFNNLLTAMVGSAQLIQTYLPADHPVQNDVKRVLAAGEQASHLTGQMLTFNKDQPVQITCVDINQIVAETVDMLQSVMPTPRTVRLQVDKRPLNAAVDESALKQVLMNLCLNARDSIAEDGVIQITCGRAPLPDRFDAAAHASETTNSDWTFIMVQDDGTGMNEEVKARIFEPFFSTKDRGTGIGMAIVQQIVKRCNGFIEVESAPQQGACFHIWLPPIG